MADHEDGYNILLTGVGLKLVKLMTGLREMEKICLLTFNWRIAPD